MTVQPPTDNPPSPHPVEVILAVGLRRLLLWAAPLSAVMLIFRSPQPDAGLYWYTLAHLSVVQVATYIFVLEMASLTDRPWFQHLRRPWLASAASLIAAAVGFSALLTLATSAAARYDVSLQFLQLLSSLDIAWVVAALYLGSRMIWSKATAGVLGGILLIACVVSIAIYLNVVGFTQSGGWLVNSGELLRIVLPSDVMAATFSLAVLLVAAKTAGQRT